MHIHNIYNAIYGRVGLRPANQRLQPIFLSLRQPLTSETMSIQRMMPSSASMRATDNTPRPTADDRRSDSVYDWPSCRSTGTTATVNWY